MATFWRHFRISGDSQQSFDLACFTLEIHHGGYWMHLDNERRKYKGGSVHYLDGVDPETCSWVECNNMAYDLGYRVRPISYWYKLPRTTKSEGFYPIRNDADAVNMTRHIPPKKRVMELYVIGGRRRQIKEAELDDKIPKPNGWHNPLNTLLASELVKQIHENVAASHHVNVTDDLNDDVVVTNNVEDVILYDDVAENEVKGDTNSYVADDDFNVDPTPADNVVLEKEILEDEAAQALREKKKGRAKFVEEGSSKKLKGKKSAKPREYNTRYKGEESVGEGDLEDETIDEEDKDFFIDSEFEQSEVDDEIFFEKEVEEPNAIEEFQEMGYAGEISADVKGSDADLTSLEGSGSEEDENGKMVPVNKEAKRKFKQFHQEVDMRNPVFEIGMKFPNATVLKNAIREYSVLNKKKIWFELNRRFKVQAKCGWNRPAHKKNKNAPKQDRKRRGVCPWRIYASSYDDKSPDSLMIKGLTEEHNCGQVKRVYHLTSTWMAKKYVGEWRLNPNWSVEGFQKQIANDLGMSLTQQMVYRTKHKATEMNAGAYEEQCLEYSSTGGKKQRAIKHE
ncbi:hypothetical protein M0R45_026821 [Rubus argutus]|uniref:PB1-like domain-containing protein n=1 Tax=Rubus argutus TaxID=59490 RepID=A0AAW1WYC1_RUBAR